MSSSPKPPSLPSADSAGSRAAPASKASSDASSPMLDQQLARLYGESLFGPWLDPAQYMAAGRRQRKPGAWGKRLAIVLLSALVLIGGVWVTRRGFSRQAAQDRAQVAKDVAAFLSEGELERLAQFLAILSPPGERLLPSDSYLDLIVQAEAVLYRYHDASRARLARIEPYLSVERSAPKRLLARLTVASNAERLASYETLKSLQSDFAKEPELWTLMASVEAGRDVRAARASWERSADLGPLWLPHRYLQCAFEARHRNLEAVARLGRHMAKVAPDAAWTRLALELARGSGTDTPAPERQAPAVAQYYEQLALVLERLPTGGSPGARRQALGRAMAAVDSGGPFILDAFDRLMDANAKELATELTAFEAWPRSNPVAQADLRRLELPASPTAPRADAEGARPKPIMTAAAPNQATASKVKKSGGGSKKKHAKSKKRGGHRRP
jgi:hypothetical protein